MFGINLPIVHQNQGRVFLMWIEILDKNKDHKRIDRWKFSQDKFRKWMKPVEHLLAGNN